MKKAIILVLMVLAAFAFVFAADEPPVVYDDINFAFQPTLARYDAMGQSGIALPTRLDSFFTNPANLGVKRGFAVSVPSFSFTMYNIQPMVSDPDAMENFNALIAGDTDAAVPFATKYLENLGSGRNMISKIDIGVALKLGVIGAGTNVQIKLHTLNEGTSVASQNVIPEVNVAQTVGLGLKIIDTDVFSFSAGASISAVYKAYFKGIGGSKILDLIGRVVGGADAHPIQRLVRLLLPGAKTVEKFVFREEGTLREETVQTAYAVELVISGQQVIAGILDCFNMTGGDVTRRPD